MWWSVVVLKKIYIIQLKLELKVCIFKTYDKTVGCLKTGTFGDHQEKSREIYVHVPSASTPGVTPDKTL